MGVVFCTLFNEIQVPTVGEGRKVGKVDTARRRRVMLVTPRELSILVRDIELASPGIRIVETCREKDGRLVPCLGIGCGHGVVDHVLHLIFIIMNIKVGTGLYSGSKGKVLKVAFLFQ